MTDVLFVQSESMMLLVGTRPGAAAGTPREDKDKFEILLAAPMLYTDAVVVIDQPARTKLRISIRSSTPVSLADQVSPPLLSTSLSSSNHMGADFTSPPPGILLPRKSMGVWQITLSFSVESACVLAAEHIEQKSQIAKTEKLRSLRKILEKWTKLGDK